MWCYSLKAQLHDASSRMQFIVCESCIACDAVATVLLLGILKKGPDPARTFKKRANQNISGLTPI